MWAVAVGILPLGAWLKMPSPYREVARIAVGPQLVSPVSGLEMKAFHQLKVKWEYEMGAGIWGLQGAEIPLKKSEVFYP